MPTRIGSGLLAGIAAAAVFAALVLVNLAVGWVPRFDPAHIVGLALGPESAVLGWLAHFLVYGLALGALFAVVAPKLSRIGYTMRGILVGVITYGFVAFVFMPAIGAGLFGLRFGYFTVPLLLVTHLVWGAVLGLAFAKLAGREMPATRPTI